MDFRPAESSPHAGPRSIDVDCRGMQCPAPILQVAKAVRQVANQPALLHVYADDGDFPADLEAWCRAAKAQLRWSNAPEEGVYHGIVALNGAPVPLGDGDPATARPPRTASAPASVPSVTPRRPAEPAKPAHTKPAPPPPRAPDPAPPEASPSTPTGYPTLHLQGEAPHIAILKLSDMLREAPRGLRVVSDDPEFRAALYAWASATRAEVRDVQQWERSFSAMVTLPLDAQQALPPREPSGAFTAPSLPVAQHQGPPRENLATLLVLHNDLETLLGAMMTANACAAQGMDVVVFFSFWGVNVLRGPNPRVSPEPKGFLQRIMQWMMPKGPRRQRLGKMDMGGMGTAMMQSFMKAQNVMPLEQHMREAIDLGVRFQVCTMSMSVMGIQKSDLMDLPNMEFLGVASFAESARRSALSLTF